MLDEKWENVDATYKNLGTADYFASQIFSRNGETGCARSAVSVPRAGLKGSLKSNTERAFAPCLYKQDCFTSPGEAGMLHKYLSTGVTRFMYVLYLIFHLYLRLQFYATLDVEIDSSSSDSVQVIY